VSGATDDISQRIGLELPEGVRVVEPADGLVQVYVQIGQRAVRQPLPGQVVKIVNLAPGLTAEWEPREVTVVVVAAADVLSRLTADDVLIQVDLDGLGPGDYDIQPSVILPPNVQWISTDPSTVHVTIRRAAATTAASPSEGTPMPAGRVAATPVAVDDET
jgi:YbbR domain-containing protein